MEESTKVGPAEAHLWGRLYQAVDAAVEEPSSTNFDAVATAALQWAACRSVSARESTSISEREIASIYRKEPQHPNAVSYLHTVEHHGGRPHAPGCEELVEDPPAASESDA